MKKLINILILLLTISASAQTGTFIVGGSGSVTGSSGVPNDGAVTTEKLADASVTNVKVDANAQIGLNKLQDVGPDVLIGKIGASGAPNVYGLTTLKNWFDFHASEIDYPFNGQSTALSAFDDLYARSVLLDVFQTYTASKKFEDNDGQYFGTDHDLLIHHSGNLTLVDYLSTLSLRHGTTEKFRFSSSGVQALDGANFITTDEAYDPVGWDNNNETLTKNAFRDKIESMSVGGSNLLPTNSLAVGGSPFTTDASFEDVVNVTGQAGTYTINLASDSTYDHEDGTILWFKNDADASITFQPDTGVTGFSAFTVFQGETVIMRKTAADTWNILGRFRFDGNEVVSNTTGLGGADKITNLVKGTKTEIESWPTDENRMDVCENCPPMVVIDSSAWDTANGTVTIEGGLTGIDDRTADEGTWTFNDLEAGERIIVHANRGSAPILAATGWTFNELTGTQGFNVSTDQVWEFIPNAIGEIDYAVADR